MHNNITNTKMPKYMFACKSDITLKRVITKVN